MAAKGSKAKFTKEQEDYFFDRVNFHAKELNLQDWHIGRSKRRPKDCMADVDISWEDKTASVALGTGWGNTEINEKTLNATALHEMLHVFFKPLMEACTTGNPLLMASAEHSVIAVLEKRFG
jgi:hypothetical protein